MRLLSSAPCRCRQLSSNVRHHIGHAVAASARSAAQSAVSLNSHDAAKPHTASQSQHRALQRTFVECGRTERHSISFIRQSNKGLVMTGAAHNNNGKGPQCHTATHNRAGNTGFQSVRRAAAFSTGPSSIGPLSRRLECAAHHGLQRGAGSTRSRLRGTTGPWQARQQRTPGAVMPNPSLKRSANGRPPGPVWRYAVHFRQPGPGVLPSSPA